MTPVRDEAKLYDVRTLERRLRRGLITKKDYEKYLKALPDRTANIATPEERLASEDDD